MATPVKVRYRVEEAAYNAEEGLRITFSITVIYDDDSEKVVIRYDMNYPVGTYPTAQELRAAARQLRAQIRDDLRAQSFYSGIIGEEEEEDIGELP